MSITQIAIKCYFGQVQNKVLLRFFPQMAGICRGEREHDGWPALPLNRALFLFQQRKKVRRANKT